MNSLNLFVCLFEWMMGDDEKKDERVIHSQNGMHVSGQKNYKVKKANHKRKKTHAEAERVERKMEAKPAG